jgi:predicted nucleic acid-binding protein
LSYLLNTNVVSELRKIGDGKVDANVGPGSRRKMQRASSSRPSLFLNWNAACSPSAQRYQAGERLRAWLDNRVRPGFAGRILPVDDEVATRCAHLHIPDRRNEVDALIAATALVHGLTVVTRNVRDFEGTAVVVVNPWQG